MRIGRYRFRPGRVPTLVVLLLLPLLLSLGFWQLDRAEQKRAWLARVEAGSRQSPVDLNASRPEYASVQHRRVTARGSYDTDRQILLENQIRDARAGYLVLTPLRLAGSDTAVLVDRGWVPAAGDRSVLPDVAAPQGEVAIAGTADRGPSVGMKLGEAVVAAGWPLRLQYLDYAAVAQRLPYPVLPYLIRLDPQAPHGYRRDWQPVAPMGPATHVGYAVQWFGLAGALLVIYLVVNTKRLETTDGD